MATWFDVFALVATFAIFGGIVYGIILAINAFNEGVSSTKENLKSKGYHISSSGVSVKTQNRFTKEDEIDAAQRGFVSIMQAGSFRKGEAPQAPEISRTWSDSSTKSTATKMSKTSSTDTEDKKKRKIFGSKS